jgi:uncharacterized protein (DUF1800 family)
MNRTDETVHVLNRLAFGPRPGDIEAVQRMGIDAYIHAQLNAEAIPIPERLVKQLDALSTLHLTPVELFVRYGRPFLAGGQKKDPDAIKAARQRARIITEEGVRARLVRAIDGPSQLQEVMTDFWFNHFNVFAGKGLDYLWTVSYEQEAIRPHTMGRFRDLLGATTRHPAMLFYLDNWLNTGPDTPGARKRFQGINENYAREVMELHTLGVNGGYTQRDVIELARIFTGWGLVKRGAPGFRPRQWMRMGAAYFEGAYRSGFYFDGDRHDFGDKLFLGHRIKGTGEAEGEAALDILARHPATAHHLSSQLAQYFVADQPPPLLIDRLSRVYLETDGNIRAVLAALFTSPEFRSPECYGRKFKTPYQFVVSAVRAAGIAPLENVRPLAATLYVLGMPLYGCQMPNGYKNTQEAWLTPDAMIRRISFVTGLGAGRLPIDRSPARLAANLDTEPTMMGAPHQPAAPLDYIALARTLGNRFTSDTATGVKAAPAQLRAALILGSPDFMRC